MNCLSRKRQEWLFRLQQELKVSETCYFVTLTYDNEHLKYNSTNDAILCKDDVQKFMKRLRKQWKEHKLRYFLCGEYGKNTYRPHYHIILFNAPEDHSPNHFKLANQIEKSWQKGHVDILDDVKGAALNYAAKYIMMRNEVPKSFVKPFILTSRRPASLFWHNLLHHRIQFLPIHFHLRIVQYMLHFYLIYRFWHILCQVLF